MIYFDKSDGAADNEFPCVTLKTTLLTPFNDEPLELHARSHLIIYVVFVVGIDKVYIVVAVLFVVVTVAIVFLLYILLFVSIRLQSPFTKLFPKK